MTQRKRRVKYTYKHEQLHTSHSQTGHHGRAIKPNSERYAIIKHFSESIKVFIVEIVLAYNCVSHKTTTIKSYRIIFGIRTTVPLDAGIAELTEDNSSRNNKLKLVRN